MTGPHSRETGGTAASEGGGRGVGSELPTRRDHMRLLGLRVLLICTSLYLYLTFCWWWNGLGGGAAFFAPASCILLWLAVKYILGLRWGTALAVAIGAALVCVPWSLSFLDPPLVETTGYDDYLIVVPLVVPFLAGATLRDRDLTAAGLITGLALAWMIPAQTWRSELRTGAWSADPYPEWLYGTLCLLFWGVIIVVTFGLAAGCAGWGLKLLWVAARNRRARVA